MTKKKKIKKIIDNEKITKKSRKNSIIDKKEKETDNNKENSSTEEIFDESNDDEINNDSQIDNDEENDNNNSQNISDTINLEFDKIIKNLNKTIKKDFNPDQIINEHANGKSDNVGKNKTKQIMPLKIHNIKFNESATKSIVLIETMLNVPVIPVRDTIIFPNTISPLFIARTFSIKAIERSTSVNNYIFLTVQKNAELESISINDIETNGTLCKVIQFVKLPDNTIKILVDAVSRAKIDNCNINQKFISANITIYKIQNAKELNDEPIIQALIRKVIFAIKEYMSVNRKINYDLIKYIASINNPDIFSDIVMSHLNVEYSKKYNILKIIPLEKRLLEILKIILTEIDIIKQETKISIRVKRQIDKKNKEFYLQEHLKAIKKELGEDDSNYDVIDKYEAILKERKFPEYVKIKVKDEIRKLKYLSPSSSDFSVIRGYLDLIIDLPWLNEGSNVIEDIIFAKSVLENGHYGLEKVKERILESIAVQIKTKQTQKNIICLYGPPGVGKTSLAKSIAEATGRKYIKIAVGGIDDEAEIRGHRKAYIGSMPGKIISAFKRVKVTNPLILFDEIDKISSNARGDPAAAMLEVLDPEQNKEFTDHYVEIPYDLSKVMFICTANSLNISRPLLDRMEIIKIPSYLEKEKFEIAKKYIVQKQITENGLTNKEIHITDCAINDIIKYYTRESGVRELNRQIEKICRKVAVQILEEERTALESMKKNSKKPIPDIVLTQQMNDLMQHLQEKNAIPKLKKETTLYQISAKNLKKFLGIKKFTHTITEIIPSVGVVNGLAYTDVGGDILLLETAKIPSDKGEIKCTGTLGDVMKESVQTAYTLLKSKASIFGINLEDIKKHDVHLHLPEGATPKDGPSAGITIVTALVSLFRNQIVSNKIAMTGEITLRGSVLPIGGLREKLTSAIRSGIEIVIIPKDNEKDLEEIPSYILKKLIIKPCSDINEVIKICFEG